MPFGHPVSTLEQRLNWLRANTELWQDMKLRALPGGTYRFFLSPEDHRKVARAMKNAGLFAKTTYELDIKIPKYIRILRGLR